jgi:DNA repair protein RadC/GNAT superfamily N-acetyltransferase
MPSLKNCLKKIGLEAHEQAIINGSVKDYRAEGYEAHKAATEAVKDYIAQLEDEGQDILSQVREKAPEAVAPKEIKSLQDLENKWKAQGVDVYLHDTPEKGIVLSSLIVPKEERRRGIGSLVMQDLTRLADQLGKRVVLTPGTKDDFHGTTSQARLKKFYKRFDFRENRGRRQDFRISETMIREPKPARKSDPNRPYANVPDSLMGFGRNVSKGFNESKYPAVLEVTVKYPDGEAWGDAIKGMNKEHALERARRNWPGAEITQGKVLPAGSTEGILASVKLRLSWPKPERVTAAALSKRQDTKLNPKVAKAVKAFNKAGIATIMSGDFYGKTPEPMVYIDLHPALSEALVWATRAGVRKPAWPDGWYCTYQDITLTERSVLGIPVPENKKGVTRTIESVDTQHRVVKKGDSISDEEIKQLTDAILWGMRKVEAVHFGEELKASVKTNTKAFKSWFGKSVVVDEDGKPLMVFHGSTFTFDSFDVRKGRVGGFLGKGPYFTDSEDDANTNYATDKGPDITGHFEEAKDRINSNFTEEELDEVLERYLEDRGIDMPSDEEKRARLMGAAVDDLARQQVMGEHHGAIYPAYLKMENPIDVDDKRKILFELEYPQLEGGEDGEYDYEAEPTGTGAKLLEAAENAIQGYDAYDSARTDLINGLSEALMGGMTAADLYEVISLAATDVMDENGDIVSAGQIFQDIVRELGFDGIIMDAEKHFGRRPISGGLVVPGMGGVAGAKHYMPFEPTQIKSAIANTGKFDPKNPSILASVKMNPDSKTGVPQFIGTGDAVAFGRLASIDQINEMRELYTASQAKVDRLRGTGSLEDLQEAMDEAFRGQFIHEAIQAAEGVSFGDAHVAKEPLPPTKLEKFSLKGKQQQLQFTETPTVVLEKLTRVITKTTGNIAAAGNVVRGVEDAASLIAPIRKAAQENAFLIIAGSDGTVLEVMRYSKGTKGAASIDPSEVIGHAANVPGAAGAYFIHNHPSKNPKPSDDDLNMVKYIELQAAHTGIKFSSLIIAGDKYVDITGTSNDYAVPKPIRPAVRKLAIPVKERFLARASKAERSPLTGPSDLIAWMGVNKPGKSGIVFMDNWGVVAGWMENISHLSPIKAYAEIYKAAEAVNANGLIFVSDGPLAINMKTFIAKVAQAAAPQIRILDVISNGQSMANNNALGFLPSTANPMTAFEDMASTSATLKQLGGTFSLRRKDIERAFSRGMFSQEDIAISNDLEALTVIDRSMGLGGGKKPMQHWANINKFLDSNPYAVGRIRAVERRSKVKLLDAKGHIITDAVEGLTRVDSGQGKFDKKGDIVPKFKGFYRSFAQTYLDALEYFDHDRRESFREAIVKSIEAAYEDPGLAVRGELGLTFANLGSKKDYAIGRPLRKAEKTMAALNLNTQCPMMTIGLHGCYIDGCYVVGLARAGQIVNYYNSAMYTAEILQLKDSDVARLNAAGGLRINGMGDTSYADLGQWRDIFRHAEMRGLKLKIITKQDDTMRVLDTLRKEGSRLAAETVVQASMDPYWVEVKGVDDVAGSAARSEGVIQKIDSGDLAGAVKLIKEKFHREAKVINGKVYRKYGYSWDQMKALAKKYPKMRFLPRVVVGTPREIAEYALKMPEVLQTWLHAKVKPGMWSDIEGARVEDTALNFQYQIAVRKIDGEWKILRQVEKGSLEAGESSPYKAVEDYIKANYNKGDQEKIFTTLAGHLRKDPSSLCCTISATKDACAACTSMCATGAYYTGEELTELAGRGMKEIGLGIKAIGRDDDLRASMKRPPSAVGPVWYSRMENHLEAKLPNRIAGGDLKALLDTWIKSGAISADEVKWSFIEDFIEGKKHPEFMDYVQERARQDKILEKEGRPDNKRESELMKRYGAEYDEMIKAPVKITKAEILDYLAKNNLRVKEQVLYGDGGKYDSWEGPNRTYGEATVEFRNEEMGPGQSEYQLILWTPPNGGEPFFEWKDSDTGDGVASGATIAEATRQFIKQMKHLDVERDDIEFRNVTTDKDLEIRPAAMYEDASLTLSGGKDYRELVITLPYSFDRKGTELKQGHYNKKYPNTVMHVRFDSREDSKGRKVLFIQEVQSDWHQAGRKEGYDTPLELVTELPEGYEVKPSRRRDGKSIITAANRKEYERVVKAYKGDPDELERTADGRRLIELDTSVNDSLFSNRLPDEEIFNEWLAAVRKRVPDAFERDPYAGQNARKGFGVYFEGERLVFADTAEEVTALAIEKINDDIRSRRRDSPSVPDAPFKSNWPLVAMRRMIRFAAEEGFDMVGWTPAAVQIDRYQNELRQRVDRITYERYEKKKENHILITAWKDGESRFSGYVNSKGIFQNGPAANNSLQQVLGKSMAEKIMAGGDGEFTGDDLSIGGQIHKYIYDQYIPQELNKAFNKKSWGNAAIETVQIAVEEDQIEGLVYRDGDEWWVRPPAGEATEVRGPFLFYDEAIEVAEELYPEIKAIPYRKTQDVQAMPITPEIRSSSTKMGFPLFSLKRVSPNPFYSQFEDVVAARRPAGPSAQVLQAINSWVKKGDIKEEEVDWSGIREWLEGEKKGKKVSAKDVADRLESHNVRVFEILKQARSQFDMTGFDVFFDNDAEDWDIRFKTDDLFHYRKTGSVNEDEKYWDPDSENPEPLWYTELTKNQQHIYQAAYEKAKTRVKNALVLVENPESDYRYRQSLYAEIDEITEAWGEKWRATLPNGYWTITPEMYGPEFTSGGKPEMRWVLRRTDENGDIFLVDNFDNPWDAKDQLAHSFLQWLSNNGNGYSNETKFSRYIQGDRDNDPPKSYRELLLVFKSMAARGRRVEKDEAASASAGHDVFNVIARDGTVELSGVSRHQVEGHLKWQKEDPDIRGGELFSNSHWDEDNVLVHVRFTERVGRDGKVDLYLEEIQSDWHQKGRKSNYRVPGRTKKIKMGDVPGLVTVNYKAIQRKNLDAYAQEWGKNHPDQNLLEVNAEFGRFLGAMPDNRHLDESDMIFVPVMDEVGPIPLIGAADRKVIYATKKDGGLRRLFEIEPVQYAEGAWAVNAFNGGANFNDNYADPLEPGDVGAERHPNSVRHFVSLEDALDATRRRELYYYDAGDADIAAAKFYQNAPQAEQVYPYVPDAPFKKTWPLLAFKRMVRWAAENGYASVNWSTGLQQYKQWGSEKLEWHPVFYGKDPVVLSGPAEAMQKVNEGRMVAIRWPAADRNGKTPKIADMFVPFGEEPNYHYAQMETEDYFDPDGLYMKMFREDKAEFVLAYLGVDGEPAERKGWKFHGQEQYTGNVFAGMEERLEQEAYDHSRFIHDNAEARKHVRKIVNDTITRESGDFSPEKWEKHVDKITDKIFGKMQDHERPGVYLPRRAGMFGFYSDALINDVNSYFNKKQWGSPKVATKELSFGAFLRQDANGEWDEPLAGFEAVHSFPITPEIRSRVTEKGLPLFSLKRIKPPGDSYLDAVNAVLNTPTVSTSEDTTADPYAGLPENVKAELKKSGGLLAPKFLQRAKIQGDEIWKSLTRHRPYLDPSMDGEITDILRTHQETEENATRRAMQILVTIIGGLKPNQYQAFSLSLIMDDMVRDIENGLLAEKEVLPFGFTKDTAMAYRDYLSSLAEADPAIAAALKRRFVFNEKLKIALVKADLLPKEVLDEDRYWHHQVLKYQAMQALGEEYKGVGPTSKDTRLHKQGWQRGRTGSIENYNTDYAESEFEVIRGAIAQLETAHNMVEIRDRADITQNLKQRAKAMNLQALYQMTADALGGGRTAEMVRDNKDLNPLTPFKSAIAMAMGALTTMAGKGQLTPGPFEDVVEAWYDEYHFRLENPVDPGDPPHQFDPIDGKRLFGFLTYLMDNNLPGAPWAGKIFKTIRKRDKFIKDTLKDRFATPSKIMPPGYIEWAPAPGQSWYKAFTITDRLVAAIQEGEAVLGQENADKIRQVLVRARDVTWIIPKGLAQTLDGYDSKREDHMLSQASRRAMGMWKQWILINPFRVLKYNLNNMSGDADVVFAYRPEIFSYLPAAIRDLSRELKNSDMDRALRAELDLAYRLGVLGSGWSVQEVSDVNTAMALKAKLDAVKGEEPGWVLRQWDNLKVLTQARENLLRLAAFRYFREQIRAGNAVYGASSQSEIDGISDPDRKAAKLARELLGDYGNITHAGQWFRAHLIPFYAWMEVNAPRYVRMMRNTKAEGRGRGQQANVAAHLGLRMGVKGGILAAKMAGFFLLTQLYNRIFWPDEEEELGEQQRAQMHLIVGRRKDGSIMTFRVQGAFSDALSWFGLETGVADIGKVIEGKRSISDQAKDMVLATPKKLINALRPDVKGAGELISGKTSYPNPFKPRDIRDRLEYLARTVSLESLYNWLRGRPKKGEGWAEQFANDLMSLALYTSDPGEMAYYDTTRKVVEWKEDAGPDPKDKSDAVYYYKQALKYGDLKAAEKYLRAYYDLGGNDKGLAASIKRAHPLGMIPKKDQPKFIETLSPEELEKLRLAEEWYNSTYRDERAIEAKVRAKVPEREGEPEDETEEEGGVFNTLRDAIKYLK